MEQMSREYKNLFNCIKPTSNKIGVTIITGTPSSDKSDGLKNYFMKTNNDAQNNMNQQAYTHLGSDEEVNKAFDEEAMEILKRYSEKYDKVKVLNPVNKDYPEIVLIPEGTKNIKDSDSVQITEILSIEEVLDRYGECAYDAVQEYLRKQEENPQNIKNVCQ